jgi:hypothetical protein
VDLRITTYGRGSQRELGPCPALRRDGRSRYDPGNEDHPSKGRALGISQAARQRQPSLQDVGLGLLEGSDLALGQQDALLRHPGVERLEAVLHRGQVVVLPNACLGKTPIQTFLDALPLANEKLMAA